MRTFLALTFSFLLAFSLFFSSAYAQDVPTLIPYVTDLAGVIDDSYESKINEYLSNLEATTTAEIAVLTVSTVKPSYMEKYAVEVFEKNGIGRADKDNGVLIVVAVDDREWRIEVGYGMEGDLNDAKAGRIGRTYMVPYFQNGQYGEGIYLTVTTIGEIILGDQELSERFDYEESDSYEIFLIAFMLFFVVASIVGPLASRICPKCHSLMTIESQKGDTVCYVCKKCGHRKCVKRHRNHAPLLFLAGAAGARGGGFSGGGFGGGGSGGGGAGGGW